MTAAPKSRFSKKILLFTGFGLLTLVLYLCYLVGTANIVDVLARTDLLLYASAFIGFVLSILFVSLT